MTTNSDGRVTELELDGNGLSGTLPTELGDLTELASLRLNGNAYLAGPLPAGLRELSALATVDLADTELCAPEDDAFQTWLAAITFSGLICPPESQTVIDVAVFYTPAARDDAGGTAAIEAEIDLMAAETNLAYRASGVNQRVVLAAVEEVEYGEDPGIPVDRLQDPSDGHMDGGPHHPRPSRSRPRAADPLGFRGAGRQRIRDLDAGECLCGQRLCLDAAWPRCPFLCP